MIAPLPKGPYGRCRKCNVVWALEGRPLVAKQQTRYGACYAGSPARKCPDCRTTSIFRTALALMSRPIVKPWQERGDVR